MTRHKDHIILNGNKKILKSALIYGANASGKSNLIKAVHFSRKIILNGLEKVDLRKQHFRIRNETYCRPGVFEYRILTNGKEYSYGLAVSYEREEIISEWLVRMEGSGKEIYLYNREVEEDGKSHVSTEVVQKRTEENIRL